MKNIISIISLITILIFTNGCSEDWLDVRPETDVVLEDFWQDENQVNQVLSSCYLSMLQGDALERMLIWGELRSDNVLAGQSMKPAMEQILNVDITPSNEYCSWLPMYRTINYCNTFLYYAPGVVDLDANFSQSEYLQLSAEVRAIRAFNYFYLVRTFKEVPYISEPSIDDNQDYNIPKSSEDVIIDNIIADLEFAVTYARDKFEIEAYKKGRITKNAARAMLADVYLWINDNQKVIQYCDAILNDSEQGLQLVDGEDVLADVFYNGNSVESIFEFQYDDDIIYNGTLNSFFGGSRNTYGQWSFPDAFVDGENQIFDKDIGTQTESEYDLREKDFLYNNGAKNYVFKYAGAKRQENEANGYSIYYYRSNTANWIVYRLSEIKLMKAEALIQLSQTDFSAAFELINEVYVRSNDTKDHPTGGLDLNLYNSKVEIEKLFLREHQRELMFEGKRWFTLMRMARRVDDPSPALSNLYNKGGTGLSKLSKMSVMDALYLPINTGELKRNAALEQNPYYESIATGYN